MSEYGLWRFGCGSGNYTPSKNFSKKPRKENDILRSALNAAREKYTDIFLLKIHGSGYQRAGIPDVYVALKGISIWVEFKRPGGDTTALQHRTLNQLASLDVYCGTAESTETFLQLIEDALNEQNLKRHFK